MERKLFAAALILTAVVAAYLGRGAFPDGLMRDFHAFYCAGQTIDAGSDPFLAEPLGTCERVAAGFGLHSQVAGLAMPAPLPPYALAPFALIARLPYAGAALLWLLTILASVAATVVAMRRLTGLPWPALAAGFALSDGYAAAALGQIAPVAVAAIAWAAAFADEGLGAPAGWCASLAMLEPHLGLAPCAALFLRVRSARIPLLGAAGIFAITSLAIGGPARTAEYFRLVVPAHALSEVANPKQFSFTHLLALFGVPDAPALVAGELQFALTALAGTVVGFALATRLRSDALVVAVPAAFAVLGGPFMHVVQIAVASVAALVLYARLSSERARAALGLAIVALAIPWVQFLNLGQLFPILAALAAGVLTWTLVDRRPLVLLAVSTTTLLVLFGLEALILQAYADPTSRLVAAYDPHALAEAGWGLYVRLVATENAIAYEFAKIPTILGLLTVLGVAIQASQPVKKGLVLSREQPKT